MRTRPKSRGGRETAGKATFWEEEMMREGVSSKDSYPPTRMEPGSGMVGRHWADFYRSLSFLGPPQNHLGLREQVRLLPSPEILRGPEWAWPHLLDP